MEENGKAGKYDIRTVIGRGAAGVVYEGWDPVLERKVAIKTLPLDVHDEEAREQYTRFQQEAQAAARLHHPNIVSVFDYGETATHAFIVMEFLGGGSLKSRLERKDRMSLVEVVRVMRGVLAGLYHSHAHGVVHRDVKPANIVFDDAGEVKITDFGIARLENSKLTLDGALLGTPAYMSPEQVLGETADVRSDIYSAGVILYELLTGQRPFEGTASSIMHKIVHAPPPRASTLPIQAPPHFDEILERALAKAPDDRYQSAVEFSRALPVVDSTLPVTRPALLPDPPVRAAESVTDGADRTVTRMPALETVSATVSLATPIRPSSAMAAEVMPAKGGRLSPALLGAGGLAVVAVAAGVGWFVLGGTAPPEPKIVAKPPEPTRPVEPAHPPAPPRPEPRHDVAVVVPSPVLPPEPAKPVAPPDPQAALRPLLAGPIGAMPCAVVRPEFGAGTSVTLTGLTSLGETSDILAEGALRGAVARTPGIGAVESRIQQVDGPFCGLFDALKPIFAGEPGASAGLELSVENASALRAPATTPRLGATMPDFAAALLVDRFVADGSVLHLVVPAADAPLAGAGTVIPLGATAATAPAWMVSPADGESVLVAIAASEPLGLGRRPQREAAAAYLRDLGAAVNTARGNGARVAATVTSLGAASR